jgi:hypothetical protein
MKQLLAFFGYVAHRRATHQRHDDSLRANQFNEPRRSLSPWLIMIS